MSPAKVQTCAAALATSRRSWREPRIARIQHDIGAGFRKRERDDAAKAAASAGDEGTLPVEPETIKTLAVHAYCIQIG